jgi:hypothetical protein
MKNKNPWPGKTAKEPIPVPKVDSKRLAFLRSCSRYDCDKELKKEIGFFEQIKE